MSVSLRVQRRIRAEKAAIPNHSRPKGKRMPQNVQRWLSTTLEPILAPGQEESEATASVECI